MKNTVLIIIGSCLTLSSFAQTPEDVLKYSWNAPGGTARNQAIGGAMGSLGGDITALFTNPAGLGFYKTSEFVISPGFSSLRNKTNFRDGRESDNKSAFNLGTTGFVFGFNDRNSKWASKAFSIAVTRTANFNSNLTYQGTNDFSSFSEQYAEELSRSGVNINNTFNSNLSLPTKMAAYTYLIDIFKDPNGGPDSVVRGRPEIAGITTQRNHIETKGGVTELALGFAANMDDKVYIGGSLGVPIVNYQRKSIFTETDASGNTNNDFGFSRLEENYSTKGVGVNAKLGMIFKPVESFRFGLAVLTPTLYGLKDEYSGKMVTDVEKLYTPSVDSINTEHFTGSPVSQYKYDLFTPWRFMVSGSYVLHEVEDVSKQKGFITADIEYVSYRSNKYSSAEENADDSYYDGVNEGIKNFYKNAFNFRVGGELKFTTIMARLGFAYYGNPYKEKDDLQGRKMFVSGGLGYRDKGIFVDLTYVLALNRDVHFPYRLADKANTFATVNQTAGNVALTFGVKF
jgi:hypothetical protein